MTLTVDNEIYVFYRKIECGMFPEMENLESRRDVIKYRKRTIQPPRFQWNTSNTISISGTWNKLHICYRLEYRIKLLLIRYSHRFSKIELVTTLWWKSNNDSMVALEVVGIWKSNKRKLVHFHYILPHVAMTRIGKLRYN